MLDLRARRAILQAIDRATLAETMLGDRGMVANTIPPPESVPYGAALKQALVDYPYDPQQSARLLAELGYTKSADGIFASPTDGRFTLEIRGVSGGSEEKDTTLVANYLQAAGFDPKILLPQESCSSSGRFRRLRFSRVENSLSLEPRAGLLPRYGIPAHAPQ